MGGEDETSESIEAIRRHLSSGDPGRALRGCDAILAVRPRDVEALHLRGLALRATGRAGEAAASFERALDIAPGIAVLHTCLGNAYKALGRLGDAIESHRRAVECSPDFAGAWSNLGGTLLEAGQPKAAVHSLQQAVRIQPASAELHHNLGRIQIDARDLPGAVLALSRAIELDPAHVPARITCGSALRRLGQLDRALEVLDGAVRLAPGHADAHWNRALVLLMRGDYAEGWAEYEWRRSIADMRIERFSVPDWDGAPLAGRTLLVHAEQGMGDTFQFARFALAVAERGPGQVILRCPARLAELLGGLLGDVRVVASDQPVPAFDVHAPLLSLPHLLGVDGGGLASPMPYLGPDPGRISRWRARIDPVLGLRVGVCWQGNPGYEADHERSMPLDRLLPLSRLPGVSLVSLQKGHGREQLAAFQGAIHDLGSELDEGPHAFAATAAVIAQLDLLVCTDTALPHLAGALGKEVWLLLPAVPDWRWMLTGDRCPWYPSMRLFRQHQPGDWDGVVGRVADALIHRNDPHTA